MKVEWVVIGLIVIFIMVFGFGKLITILKSDIWFLAIIILVFWIIMKHKTNVAYKEQRKNRKISE